MKLRFNQIQLTEKLALGEDVELHEVMIASQKASITIQSTWKYEIKQLKPIKKL